MRRGEVLALRWEDIDVDGGWIHVSKNAVFAGRNKAVIGQPKTKKGERDVPLAPALLEHLGPLSSTGYVLGGDAPLTLSAYNCAMKRIKKTIDLHGATAHIFRHTYASLLNATGAQPKAIQSIIGHADINTTMNIYVHRDKEQEVEAVRNVCVKLAEAV